MTAAKAPAMNADRTVAERLGGVFADAVNASMAGTPGATMELACGANICAIVAAAMAHPEWGQALAMVAHRGVPPSLVEAGITSLLRAVPIEVRDERD